MEYRCKLKIIETERDSLESVTPIAVAEVIEAATRIQVSFTTLHF